MFEPIRRMVGSSQFFGLCIVALCAALWVVTLDSEAQPDGVDVIQVNKVLREHRSKRFKARSGFILQEDPSPSPSPSPSPAGGCGELRNESNTGVLCSFPRPETLNVTNLTEMALYAQDKFFVPLENYTATTILNMNDTALQDMVLRILDTGTETVDMGDQILGFVQAMDPESGNAMPFNMTLPTFTNASTSTAQSFAIADYGPGVGAVVVSGHQPSAFSVADLGLNLPNGTADNNNSFLIDVYRLAANGSLIFEGNFTFVIEHGGATEMTIFAWHGNATDAVELVSEGGSVVSFGNGTFVITTPRTSTFLGVPALLTTTTTDSGGSDLNLLALLSLVVIPVIVFSLCYMRRANRYYLSDPMYETQYIDKVDPYTGQVYQVPEQVLVQYKIPVGHELYFEPNDGLEGMCAAMSPVQTPEPTYLGGSQMIMDPYSGGLTMITDPSQMPPLTYAADAGGAAMTMDTFRPPTSVGGLTMIMDPSQMPPLTYAADAGAAPSMIGPALGTPIPTYLGGAPSMIGPALQTPIPTYLGGAPSMSGPTFQAPLPTYLDPMVQPTVYE